MQKASSEQSQGAHLDIESQSCQEPTLVLSIKLWFGWQLSAEHIFLNSSDLPLSPHIALCQTEHLLSKACKDITFPDTSEKQFLLLLLQVLLCTQLLSAGTKLDTVTRTRKAFLYSTREPAKLLHVSDSTNSVNSDFSLRFHFRKCGVSQP